MSAVNVRRLIVATIFVSFDLLLFAALPPYTVERLPLHAQLPSENVRCVWQDADGYVWLGTEDGAVRYDGHRLSVVRNNATTLRILADNEVLSMAESRDFLLFGTARGLTVRDKRSGAFRTLRHADVRDAEVRTLATDSEGRVYVGTKKRLVRLSADLATVTRFPSLPVTSVNAVYASPAGGIVATFWDRGAYIYNKVSGAFDKFPTIGTRDCPFSVLADGRDALWLSSWTDGFFRAVRTGKRWRVDKVETPDALRVVYRMARQPKTGLIWTVGTGGPHVVRATAGRLAIEDDAAITSSMQKPFNSVFADRSGNVWVASQVGGVYMAYPDQRPWRCLTLPEMRQITGIDTDIRALTRDTGGRLWVAQTGGGVALLAGDGTPAWLNPSYRSHYIPLNDTRQLLASRHIKGEVWAATTYESALYRLAAEGGRPRIAERIGFNRLHGGTVRALCEDSHGRLWIATERGVWLRGKDGKVSYARLAVPDATAIVAIDSHQSPRNEASEATTLYIASGTRGLIAATYGIESGSPTVLSLRNLTPQTSALPSRHIAGVAADMSEHCLWIVSREGAFTRLDLATGRMENHTEHVASFLGAAVVGVTLSPTGHVWIATSRSLLRYAPRDHSVSVYAEADGLPITLFSGGAVCNDVRQEMLFAGHGGIVSIHSTALPYATCHSLAPRVADVRIGQRSVSAALSEQRREIHLDCDARDIEIDFASCDYRHGPKIVYAYRLEGIDRQWRYTAPGTPLAYYTSLPRGTRTLLVRSTDANGHWLAATTRYRLHRQPAWFETWWAFTLYALLTVTAVAAAVLAVRRRLSEQERARVERLERQKQEELVQSKLRYFTSVSHDFLTPITVIQCIIDEMRMTLPETPTPSSALRAAGFGRISTNLLRLRQLIQQVLDFRKLEHGKMSLHVTESDLVAFLRTLCDTGFKPLMAKKGLLFAFTSPLPFLSAWFDGAKIEKIVSNLLSNAYKYTATGHVRVTLTRDADYAVITVEDTGCGIPATALPHIFERFYTGAASGSESNGIGLNVVHELTDLHHATISVASRQGSGTQFTLRLPILRTAYDSSEIAEREQDAAKLELPTAPVPSASAEGSAAEPQKGDDGVLIVEDNDELRALMERVFARYYNVRTAGGGSEALARIAEEEPQVVISDVMMPEMDGLEMCRKIKGDIATSHIPVVLLTARNTPDDRVQCYDAGADGYISKPFELTVLKARIDNFLSQKRKRQDEFRKEGPTSPTEGEATPADSTAPGDSEALASLRLSPLDRALLDRALAAINEHIADDAFDIAALADTLCMSKSTLYRKIKAVTGLSPVEFIRNTRLKRARALLLEGDVTVADVAYRCGFGTPRYFSTCFKTEFGVTPTELLTKP